MVRRSPRPSSPPSPASRASGCAPGSGASASRCRAAAATARAATRSPTPRASSPSAAPPSRACRSRARSTPPQIVAETPEISDATLAAVVAHAPTPTLVLAGPTPLRVVYANGPLRAFPGEEPTGRSLDALPWFAGSDLERTLRTLFSSDAPALECTHPAWNGGDDRARSLAWRLPVRENEPPTVALVGIDRAQDRRTRRELIDARRELRALRRREQRQERWLALASALAERFQHETGERRPRQHRRHARAQTVRGRRRDRRLHGRRAGARHLQPRPARTEDGDRHRLRRPDGADAGGAARLALPAAGGAFGAPGGLHSLAVPITVVGETLGMLLLVFDEPTELDGDARQLLTIVSAGLGFTLLRDRLVESSAKG